MKINTHGRYVFIISLDILYFIKNNIVSVKKRKIPSERTIVQHDANMKDKNIIFLSYLKKSTNDDTPNKMNNGSVIPNNELRIILGSNANSVAPTSAIFSSKYFLHKK
jgi:hypothetical protein